MQVLAPTSGIKNARARDKAYLALAEKMIKNKEFAQAIAVLKSLDAADLGATLFITKILPQLVDANRFDLALYGTSVIKNWCLKVEIIADITTFIVQARERGGLDIKKAIVLVKEAKALVAIERQKNDNGQGPLKSLRENARDPIFR